MLNQPFFQITLPLMVTFIATVWLASWSQNKRLDEMSKRFDENLAGVNRRLERIEARLDRVEERLNALEMRAWR